MMQHPKVYELLQLIQTSRIHDIELQSLEIYLFHKQEFEGGQVGYRYDKKGNSLIGEREGNWQESWFVIGYDTDLGNPVFVDIQNLHVYIAERGMSTWNPACIMNHIDEIMEYIRNSFHR
ncbi:thiamine transporter [Bacillus sp. BP-3]|uniref:thiamine transporter n=1 Tax=Bacillus sp. BP-3 TaxID=3022773 RepID=UPI00232EB4C8|nr:thiamine transporter [Bacillus sp. BP-3]MDC2864987.1 thiamine transporter [Bacillus sp. BP-3]